MLGSVPARVLCVGDMVADILARPVGCLPGPGEVGVTEEVAFAPGGNALNTALALRRLGQGVRFVGAVGEDALGDLLVSSLERAGVGVEGVSRMEGVSTPTTLIYRQEGEDRRFLHAMGAAERFTGEGIEEGWIPEGGVLYVGGYLKLRRWDDGALVELFRAARRRGSRVVLNVCIPGGGHVDVRRCLGVLSEVDLFLPNEDEARVITGEEDVEFQARVLREAGARRVVITRGARGLYGVGDGRVVRMGVFDVPVVDPSGCGDCFTAGLITSWLRGGDFLESLRFGSGVAAMGAMALGCTAGVPEASEVERFMVGRSLEVVDERGEG